MLKGFILLVFSFISVSNANQEKSFELKNIDKTEFKKEVQLPEARMAIDNKYNQQNIALSKIKVNTFFAYTDNIVIIQVEGNIDLIVKDLTSYGLNFSILENQYIMVDFTGKNFASKALGLAKIYYVKNVFVSQNVYNELFSVRAINNRIGTITGQIANTYTSIVLNKIQWTITGKIKDENVNLRINHENGIINGLIGNKPVFLNFLWSPEGISVRGTIENKVIQYQVSWKEGVLQGYLNNNEPIYIKFDMKEGLAGENIIQLNGYSNNTLINLEFDKISGNLYGQKDKAYFNMRLTNCDLYDFLQYIFIF